MNINPFMQAYDFTGRSYLLTGGTGVLGGEIARALYLCGANVAIIGRNLKTAQQKIASFEPTQGNGRLLAVQADVLQVEAIQAAVDRTLQAFGRIDGLVNAAGGNQPAATSNAETSFFDLPSEALRWVFDLNLMGTILPSQIVGRQMAKQKDGVILNFSSMASFRPLTRVSAYAAAKAGVNNFTQWLAVYLAQEVSPNIRVNAIAPGFFITEQNRFLLTEKESGDLTARGKAVIQHTPMKRFGLPEDLLGTALWLLSPAASFVTGIVVPVDGGFSAFSGV